MEKRTVTLLATVLVLCACTAWASVAGDGKASAVEVERVKASAEKGDAATQFRYAEMMRDRRGGAKSMREAVTSGTLIEVGVQELNAGRLTAAKSIFLSVSTNSTALERAIALKHLGTVRFRLGDRAYREDFESSEKLFRSLQDYERGEYSKVLYQKANCLLSDFENVLVEKRIQGIPSIPFPLIRDYLHPAAKAIDEAVRHYPQGEIYDIVLLKIDMALAEARLWLLCNQKKTAYEAYRKAFALASQGVGKKEVPSDALKKIMLRYATVVLECPREEVNTWKVGVDDALAILHQAVLIESGNIELDYAIRAFYLRQVLHARDFKRLEGSFQNEVLALVESVEKLNSSLMVDLDYVGKKSYFSMRTAVYEVLMEYFAACNKPFEMLLAMNRMRSRALQSTLWANEDCLSEEQLKDELKRDNSLLVAYFVGVDAVWMVGFSQHGGEILRSKRSGREIVAISKKVVQTFSSPTRLFMFCRSGAKAVPEAYALSFELYKELFFKWHEKFKMEKVGRVCLMPNHYLNYLPFPALVTEMDSENVFHSRFVAHEGIPICYMPVLPTRRKRKNGCGEKRSIVLARGDYSKPAYYYNNDINSPDTPTGEPLPLPGAINEGQEVAKLLHVAAKDFLQEEAASEYNLLKNTEDQADVVHIASHAHLVSSDPMTSYVVLSAGNGEDGKVTVDELFNRYRSRINTSLLTLSACNTNRGEDNIRPGDDIAALSCAFLVAGAKSVIATQWPASDETFPKIMSDFYKNYITEERPEVALAAGLRSYLNDNCDSVKVFPIFWGNITVLRSEF